MEDRSINGSFALRWLGRLLPGMVGEPQDRDELIGLLKQAKDRALFDTEALAMIEGVLQVADLQVRDIMIPRAQMVVVGRDHELSQVLPVVVESAHSRFPVIDDDRAEVVGILRWRFATFQNARYRSFRGVRPGEQAAQRLVARIPRQPESHGDRDR